MDIGEFLARKGLSLPAVLAGVQAAVGIERTDRLLAVGSLAEGLGNSKSDLDLLLLTSRGANPLPIHEIGVVVDKCLFDMQVVNFLALEELVLRFRSWSAQPWDLAHAAGFTLEERRLLHRLLHCAVLFGDKRDDLVAQFPTLAELSRLKLHVARQTSRTVQVDMAGNRECGDYSSLVFAAQDLLGHAVDALNAAHNFTNPTTKWRSRILGGLPENCERLLGTRPTGLTASELVWELHRAPSQPNRISAVEHSLRIATFARAVFAWAERRLLRGVSETRSLTEWPHAMSDPFDMRLPILDMDVDYFELDDQVCIARLNDFGAPLELSLDEFAIALLFDGVTTVCEAARAVYGAHANEASLRRVRRVISKVVRADLSIPYCRQQAITGR